MKFRIDSEDIMLVLLFTGWVVGLTLIFIFGIISVSIFAIIGVPVYSINKYAEFKHNSY